MKKILAIVGLMLLSFAVEAALPTLLLDDLKSSGIAQENVAVYVQAVDGSQPSIVHQAKKSMNPASVMKLVTTHAALALLTPAYRWKTEVYRNGTLTDGVLHGDLIFKGYGDPSFKAQDFWRLLMRIQQLGIKEITGNIIIDKTVFAREVGERETFDEETWRAYNAGPSAFLVNGRNTSFKFTTNNGGVEIHQEFELPEVTIVNKMQLKNGACGSWRDDLSYEVKPNAQGTVVIFKGRFSAECDERYLELSVLNDTQYAFNTFKKLWQSLGGKFSGSLRVDAVSSDAVKVTEQFSEPLLAVIRDLNKWSNNIMARQLLLTLAIEKKALPATEVKGAETIKDWLLTQGFNFNELVIENGAGLSRLDRVSAEHLGQLLVSAYNSPIMPELMASLPILALDGTVKKRLNDRLVQGRAHLKTGSLNGVSTIAGYILDAKNRRQVMVVLVNDAQAAQSKKFQDHLIEWVYAMP